MEGLFVVEDLHNIGPDYDPTLMAWWDNFDRTYSEIAHRYDRKFYQMWKFYLLAAAGASRSRDGQLYQLGAHEDRPRAARLPRELITRRTRPPSGVARHASP